MVIEFDDDDEGLEPVEHLKDFLAERFTISDLLQLKDEVRLVTYAEIVED